MNHTEENIQCSNAEYSESGRKINRLNANKRKKTQKALTSKRGASYAFSAIAKNGCRAWKLERLSKANISTPILNRAFFVRSLRTPKERLKWACSSMVACSGQGYALDCFPLIAVFPPRCTLSPYTVESVADSSSKFIKGLSTMIFKFLTLGKNRLKISVYARNEQEARAKLSFTSPAILCARLNAKGGFYA